MAMGILGIFLSWKYKIPILIAWSTASAALLVGGVEGVSMGEVIGAFIFSASCIFLVGITGIFSKLMNKIPLTLANALLAGVLFKFCIDIFSTLKEGPWISVSMIVAYFFVKKFKARYAIVGVLAVGLFVSTLMGKIPFESFQVSFTHWHFTRPEFSMKAIFSIGIPLFIVTMTSQNLPGIAAFRSHGFATHTTSLISWTGFTNLLVAPFGGFSINLAAITAAIGLGPEAHENKNKRYIVGLVSGFFYLFIGIFAGTMTSLFAALPHQMILTLVGLALLGTTSSSLHAALNHDSERESAFLCFIVTASGLSLFGVGSAFWGVVAGGFIHMIFKKHSPE